MPDETIPKKTSTHRDTPAEKEQTVRLVRTLRAALGADHGTVQRVPGRLTDGVESVGRGSRRPTWATASIPGFGASRPG